MGIQCPLLYNHPQISKKKLYIRNMFLKLPSLYKQCLKERFYGSNFPKSFKETFRQIMLRPHHTIYQFIFWKDLWITYFYNKDFKKDAPVYTFHYRHGNPNPDSHITMRVQIRDSMSVLYRQGYLILCSNNL